MQPVNLLRAIILLLLAAPVAWAGQLTVELSGVQDVRLVGAMNRWDADGNPRQPVNPKAKIDQPAVTAKARRAGRGKWVFDNLPPGRYDLVVLAGQRMRIEGFHYPPVLEFDPFIMHGQEPPAKAVQWISNDIAQSRHYENKVTPLYFAGDAKQVRVLVQLLRDKPTSYDRKFGQPVATIRHEVWQYINRYGGWAKERRTRVLDRILMAKSELRRWTWIWVPELGGVQVGQQPVTVRWALPARLDDQTARGLLPY